MGRKAEWTMLQSRDFTVLEVIKRIVCDGFFSPVALQANAGHGLLIHEVSRSHNDAPQSVAPLWTSDQLIAHIST